MATTKSPTQNILSALCTEQKEGGVSKLNYHLYLKPESRQAAAAVFGSEGGSCRVSGERQVLCSGRLEDSTINDLCRAGLACKHSRVGTAHFSESQHCSVLQIFSYIAFLLFKQVVADHTFDGQQAFYLRVFFRRLHPVFLLMPL
jgi:hypothetical protein